VIYSSELQLPAKVEFPTVTMGEETTVMVEGNNSSEEPVVIENIKTSCGCTKTSVSGNVIAPGDNILIKVTVNTNQKIGIINKNVRVYYSGNVIPDRIIISGKVLPLPRKSKHPKVKGISIFSKDCQICHVTPGNNKFGKDLYMTDCAFCHGTNRQGEYAPPLTNPMSHWYQVVTTGTNINMPGFLKENGGTRTKSQINSLMSYLKSPEQGALDESHPGRLVYYRNCSVCHGSQQLGGLGPNLQEAKKNYSTKSLSKLLKEGTDHLMMPSFLKENGGVMSGNQIDALSKYLIEGK